MGTRTTAVLGAPAQRKATVAAFWIATILAGKAASSAALSAGPSNAQRAADAPTLEQLLSAARRSEQAGDLADAVRSYDLAIAHAGASPLRDPELLLLRASTLLRVGRIGDSLADFERALALDPRQGPYLWQRGIALYYAGRFEECARQFEAHRTVNPADVENAAWHFACVAAHRGIEPARAELLPVGRDRRVPMAEIYQLFAGRLDRAAVLAAAEGAAPDVRTSARFYAYFYLGLHDETHGRRREALDEIERSLASGIGGYMADVARVHLQLRSAEAARP